MNGPLYFHVILLAQLLEESLQTAVSVAIMQNRTVSPDFKKKLREREREP